MKTIDPRRWIPKGGIKDYYMQWFTDIPENCDRGYVGVIRNFSDENTEILIEIDDQWMAEEHQRGCCLNIGESYYKNSVIVITKDFFDAAIQQDDESLFLFWHEMGHYHTLHHFPDYALNTSAMRRQYINHGQIPPAEYVADLIALLYIQEEAAISSLTKLIRARHKLTDQDDNALMAWHELRQRKKALKELHDDEDLIINEIIKACGVGTLVEV